MKAIVMSIKPQHVANILNGLKTLEIRKKFPKDYVGWVYIYCTKDKPYLYRVDDDNHFEITNKLKPHTEEYVKDYNALNGKVIARFWCDKVEEISDYLDSFVPNSATFSVPYRLEGQRELLKRSCLTHEELIDYLKESEGCAIRITKVEPFDNPKEISEFYTTKLDKQLPELFDNSIQLENGTWVKPLTRAPESYCYIEIE